ncbi:MAG: hypothetical protein R2750_14275 [Bacteroidales bacterium]
MVKHLGNLTKIKAIKAKSIDTTGAGDLYASDFFTD